MKENIVPVIEDSLQRKPPLPVDSSSHPSCKDSKTSSGSSPAQSDKLSLKKNEEDPVTVTEETSKKDFTVEELVSSNDIQDQDSVVNVKALSPCTEMPPKEKEEPKPRTKTYPSLRSRRQKVIDDEVKVTRKRKSLLLCQNQSAVTNKIQFWKGKEDLSKKSKIVSQQSSLLSEGVSLPKKERKAESLVNELLKQTLTDHKLGIKSADDTISIFDEIFASNCPPTLDESLESDFNSLFNEANDSNDAVVMTSTCKSGETNRILSISLLESPESELKSGGASNSPLPHVDKHAIEEKDKSQMASPTTGHGDRDSPSLHSMSMVEKGVLDTTVEKVESTGKYKCGDCGKEFKFLTYLKSHQNSKSSCKKNETKKRRSSMVFSTSMNFSKLQSL